MVDTLLITGASGFIGKKLLSHYLKDPVKIYLLCERQFLPKMQGFLDGARMAGNFKADVQMIEGDITRPDLGLKQNIVSKIEEETSHVLHLAAAYHLKLEYALGYQVNVRGTENVLHVIEGMPKLKVFGYLSTTAISGTHCGFFGEEDFDVGQKFKNDYEKTKYEAEKRVREKMGTAPFQPKNRPQDLRLKAKKKIDFCLIVESEGTANTLVNSGFTKRHSSILLGAQGVPSNAVRGWTKLIQDQLNVPCYFFGDLDAYTMQNIFRTLKAGSAGSLIRNSDFSAPEVLFLGVLPEDIKKYDLPDYAVKENDASESRALKKARDALNNDPFFKDKRNKGVADILKWLIAHKRRCEQQAFFSVNPRDPLMPEKIILEKIKNRDFV